MLKNIKIIILVILASVSFQSSANLIQISVSFEATDFTDLFGNQQFPFASISGTSNFLIDTSINNTGVYLGDVLPTTLNLVIDGKVWLPTETLISYIFQGNVLTHFTLGGVISVGDSPFNISGTENDFSIDKQGLLTQGSASVALKSAGTIFNSQNLTLNTTIKTVSEPSVLLLLCVGLFGLFRLRR